MLTTEPRLPALPHLGVLHAGSTAPAIVLVPGLLGLGLVFARFARAVAAGRVVYAFDLPGADPDEPVRELAIEEIADLFQPQLLAICTHSPVVLGGYSLGALIACELALRLQRPASASVNVSAVPAGAGPSAHESDVTLSGPISGDASL